MMQLTVVSFATTCTFVMDTRCTFKDDFFDKEEEEEDEGEESIILFSAGASGINNTP